MSQGTGTQGRKRIENGQEAGLFMVLRLGLVLVIMFLVGGHWLGGLFLC